MISLAEPVDDGDFHEMIANVPAISTPNVRGTDGSSAPSASTDVRELEPAQFTADTLIVCVDPIPFHCGTFLPVVVGSSSSGGSEGSQCTR